MKAAIVGLGGMGRHHLADALKCKSVSAVAGCDVNAELCRKAEKDFGVPTFPDVPSLLRDWKPQAVVVATPPNHHAEVIRACVNAGVAVLTEKPICSDYREAGELVRFAEKHHVPFQVGFEVRYCGMMRAVLSLIENGDLGRISHVGLTQFSGPKDDARYMTRERTGGIFYEKLCHQIDTFRFILGEPVRIMAVAAPNALKHYGVEDNVVAVVEFSEGRLGTIKFDTRRAAQVDGTQSPEKEFDGLEAGHFYEFIFTGDKGTAIYDAWTECVEVVRFNHRKDLQNELVRKIDVRKEFGEPVYDIAAQDGDFFARVAEGKPPRFPASDALKTMFWVERAEESLRRHGEWVTGQGA